jgi:hypothetical protein
MAFGTRGGRTPGPNLDFRFWQEVESDACRVLPSLLPCFFASSRAFGP